VPTSTGYPSPVSIRRLAVPAPRTCLDGLPCIYVRSFRR
jgi:hypothetical protein